MSGAQTPAGWYHAEGDPPGTVRQWDGSQWVGEPVIPGAAPTPGGFPPPAQFDQPGAVGGYPPGMYQPSSFSAPTNLISAGSRIGGRVIDAIVWAVLGFITNWPILSRSFSEAFNAAQEGRDPAEVDISLGLALTTSLINIALVLAYEVFMNTRFGGTLGKKATAAKIVKEDGSALDNATALRRMIPYLVIQAFGVAALFGGSGAAGWLQILILVVVALAGLIMVFSDDRRQAPWDKVAKTLVVVR